MAKEFIGNSANLYLLPYVQGEGDAAVQKYAPMAELILLTIEQQYTLDGTGRVVKSQGIEQARIHVSLGNLTKCISSLNALREQMEVMGNDINAHETTSQIPLPGM